MPIKFHLETTVLPGHRIEVIAPELPEGAKIDLIVTLSPARPEGERPSMLDYLRALPARPLLFKTAEDVHDYMQQERDSWER